MDGLKSLVKLEKLYIGNNLISKIDELNNLANLPELKDVVFKGNPFTLENPSLWNSKPQDRNPTELYPEILNMSFTPMAKKKSLQEAIADWEKENEGKKLSDEEWVDLIFRGISDLDSNSLNYIKNCKKLSLSSNFITKIPDLHFDNLEILSLGRNKIR